MRGQQHQEHEGENEAVTRNDQSRGLNRWEKEIKEERELREEV